MTAAATGVQQVGKRSIYVRKTKGLEHVRAEREADRPLTTSSKLGGT